MKFTAKKIKFNKKGELVFIWGFTNNNQPYKGGSFELSNFNDKEILSVLKNYLEKKAHRMYRKRN